MNPSGIEPTEYKVLIEQDKVEEKTKGGIILPDEHKDRQQFAQVRGRIVAMSPFAFPYEKDWPDDTKPQPGDRVMFAKFAGADVEGADGKTYRIANDKDVTAVLRYYDVSSITQQDVDKLLKRY